MRKHGRLKGKCKVRKFVSACCVHVGKNMQYEQGTKHSMLQKLVAADAFKRKSQNLLCTLIRISLADHITRPK